MEAGDIRSELHTELDGRGLVILGAGREGAKIEHGQLTAPAFTVTPGGVSKLRLSSIARSCAVTGRGRSQCEGPARRPARAPGGAVVDRNLDRATTPPASVAVPVIVMAPDGRPSVGEVIVEVGSRLSRPRPRQPALQRPSLDAHVGEEVDGGLLHSWVGWSNRPDRGFRPVPTPTGPCPRRTRVRRSARDRDSSGGSCRRRSCQTT